MSNIINFSHSKKAFTSMSEQEQVFIKNRQPQNNWKRKFSKVLLHYFAAVFSSRESVRRILFYGKRLYKLCFSGNPIIKPVRNHNDEVK